MATVSTPFNELGPIYTQRIGFDDTTTLFVKERPDKFCQIIYTIVDYLTHFDFIPEGKESAFKELRDLAKIGKQLTYPGRFLENCTDLKYKTINWFQGVTDSKTGELKNTWHDIAWAINALVDPIWQMVDLMTRLVLHIAKDSVQWLRGINGCALTLAMGKNAIKSIRKIDDLTEAKQFDADKQFKHVINLVKEVAYVILGSLTALSVFAGVAVTSWTMTQLSAFTLVCMIVGYYHDHLGEDYHTYFDAKNKPIKKIP